MQMKEEQTVCGSGMMTEKAAVQVDGITAAHVAKAYRKALLHFHPDRHVGDPLETQIYSEEAFKVVSEAANS